VDPVDPVSLARLLIDIDSTTGREAVVGRVLSAYLRERGYSVLEQPLDDGLVRRSLEGGGQQNPEGGGRNRRFNIIAAAGEPSVVFSTHFDCVPPFFASRVEGDLLRGRGACDAKGILAVQIAAAERLRAEGETRVGLVFVAGEERGSDGAMAVNRIRSPARFLVNGEPTDNRLGVATRGVYRVRLHAKGRAAHSGYPELGESAIEKLLDVLHDMRSTEWPTDDLLGTTHYTIGLINGGVAPNVIPPNAEAEIIFRSVSDHEALRATLRRVAGDRVVVEDVLEVPPVRLRTADGFDTAVFSYTTDIPFLTNWGTPLLLGPGSIHVAHTDREHIAIPELFRGVDLYVSLARRLLTS
jgi:acetylornithine deacetylase